MCQALVLKISDQNIILDYWKSHSPLLRQSVDLFPMLSKNKASL